MIIKKYLSQFQSLPKPCWKGVATHLIESTLAGVYYFFSIYFIQYLNFNISTVGILISFYGLGTILGGYLGGKWSDLISPFKIAILGLFFQALSLFFLAKVINVSFIAIDLFILGVATYAFITSNYVWVLKQCYNEINRLKTINILNIVSNLGIGISAIIVSALMSYGFHQIFYLSSILLFVLIVFLFLDYQNFESKNIFEDKCLEKNDVYSDKSKSSNLILYMAMTCLFFTGLTVSQLNTTYPIYLKTNFPSLGNHAFSTLLALSTFIIIFFQNYFVSLFKQANKVTMIGFGSFLIGLGMFLLTFSFSFLIAIIACVIYTMGEMLFFSILQLFCYQKAKSNQKGKSLGLYRMVYASSRFAGPSIGGAIYQTFGGNMVWYCSATVGILFYILFSLFKEHA